MERGGGRELLKCDGVLEDPALLALQSDIVGHQIHPMGGREMERKPHPPGHTHLSPELPVLSTATGDCLRLILDRKPAWNGDTHSVGGAN